MIQGNIVALRAVERDDLKILRDWRNRADFRRHFRESRELNMEMQQAWFERIVTASRNDFMFVIVRLADNEPVGVCGLVYVDWIIRAADVSLYIGLDGAYIDEKGLAEDAAVTLIRYGFETLNLNKVWTELYEFDERKIALFESRLGFSRDGTLRENCFDGGRYWNSYIYSRLRREHGA